MNNPITKLPNGDFKVDPILQKAREEAIEWVNFDYSYDGQTKKKYVNGREVLHFPKLKGKK